MALPPFPPTIASTSPDASSEFAESVASSVYKPNPAIQQALRLQRLPLADRSDYVWYLALALLPVDGTVLGWYMPFWTPISPWLFILYAALNWRLLPLVYRRFRVWFLLPVCLIILSMTGWVTVAFHLLSTLNSLMGIVGAIACLASLMIAVNVKHLDWRRMIHIVLVAYWCAFAVGVAQFLAIRFDIAFVRSWFSHLMSREYITASSAWGGSRPQFLFAEPSYIGMHLYGVLLPLMWLMRGRDSIYYVRLRDLIVTFAIGAIVTGAGVRIIVDSGIALVIVLVESTDFHDRKQTKRMWTSFGAMAVAGVAVALANDRIRSILLHGPVHGDNSLSARLSQAITPIMGLIQHPINLLLGFGAGNVAEANRLGTVAAYPILNGPDATVPWWVWHNWTPYGAFTMSAYVSFLVEFGVIGCALLVAVTIRFVDECSENANVIGAANGQSVSVTQSSAWDQTTICWLILVSYLYIQFEGYAFYALPLFLWAVRTRTIHYRSY